MIDEFVAVVDVETSGLSHENDKIIEIGAVLYNVKSGKPIMVQSDLIHFNAPLPDFITKITGIEQYMVEAPFAVPLKTAVFRLSKILEIATHVIGHNLQFDLRFLKKASNDVGIPLKLDNPIDTMRNIQFRMETKSKKLGHLLADHGLFNPFAHRAMFDCLSTFKLANEYGIQNIIDDMTDEQVKVIATAPFELKDKVKESGFNWDAKNKLWVMIIGRNKLKNMKLDFSYRIEEKIEIPF